MSRQGSTFPTETVNSKHVFSCINICRGSRKLFEPEAEGSTCFRETGLGLVLMCSRSKRIYSQVDQLVAL